MKILVLEHPWLRQSKRVNLNRHKLAWGGWFIPSRDEAYLHYNPLGYNYGMLQNYSSAHT